MHEEYLSKSFVEIVELIKQSVKTSPEVNFHVSFDQLFWVFKKGQGFPDREAKKLALDINFFLIL